MQLVAATTNRGKAEEIGAILAAEPNLAGIQVVTLADAGLADFEYEETGQTFVENAVGKALAASKASGLPAIADDSGLCVDALGGEPGVRSARWAGESASDSDRNRLLLERLKDVPEIGRSARFVCAVGIAWPDGEYFSAEGTCLGRIASESKGTGGFGYDPIFFLPDIARTFAELAPEEKNKVSHRRRALTQAMAYLSAKFVEQAVECAKST